jgi:hypothetical protein
MNPANPSQTPPISPLQFIASFRQTNLPLTILAAITSGTLILSILGLIFDPRATAIINTPAWSKLFKFSVSILFMTPALIWAITITNGKTRRTANVAASVIGTMLSLEMILLLIQATRARPMHFNYTTPLDAALWITMTIGIFTMFAAFVVLLIAVWRGVRQQPTIAWAIRIGMVITAVGLMTPNLSASPSTAQINALQAKQPNVLLGAHTIGSSSANPDAGLGLPLIGWSTTHGDIRIGHFIGLHALQLIPLFGVWLSRRRNLTENRQLALLWTGGLGYFAFMLLTTWQALRGQSIVAPDALTFGVGIALASLVLLSSLITILPVMTTRKANI